MTALSASAHKMPTAVFFDWDDTLIDSWSVAFAALNATLVEMGHEPWSDEEARRRRGPSAKDLFTAIFGEDNWQKADEIYYNAFLRLIKDNLEIVPDADKMLAMFKAHGIVMGVVSNKRSALLQEECRALGWDHYFSAVIGAGDAEKDKPDPAPLNLAMQKANIKPGDTVWYVGDAGGDMQCAHMAGVTAIHFASNPLSESIQKNYPPQAIFKTCRDVMEFINSEFTKGLSNSLVKKLKPD